MPEQGGAEGDRGHPERSHRRLQMADIARLAGVSTATVSRALNGSTLVNAQTRARVVELARSLNYTINAGAQNLRLGQNRTIAVVVPYESGTRQAISDPFFLALIGSLADALTDRGYDMLVSRIDADTLAAAAQYCDDGRALGVILIGQWHHHDQLNRLASRRLPIVVWGAQLPQQLYTSVGGDNVAGGQLATAALLAEGRRRIAFFGDRGLPEVAHRHRGYVEAHQAAGLAVDPRLEVPAPFLAQAGRDAVVQLLSAGLTPDGLFACSDQLAMSAITALSSAGLRVPEDISVVGYDDVEMARHFHPPLSTIRQPIDEGGRLLVDALLDLIAHGETPPRQLPATLVRRGTTR